MATLAELVKAENRADAERRAFGCLPEHQRQPGAVRDAYARWEAAHRALAEARAAELEARIVSHECPATGCTAAVSPSMLFCRPHWYMVPKPLRNAVWVTWADGAGQGTLAHCQAIRAALRVVNRKLAEAGR